MIHLWASKVWLWWRYMKFPDMDQKIISCLTIIRRWVLKWRPVWFSWKIVLVLFSVTAVPYQGGMVSEPDLSQMVLLFHLRAGIWNVHHFWALTLPLHWVFQREFWCVHLFQLLNVCDQNVSFPDALPHTRHTIFDTIDPSYKYEIKSKTIGLHQIADITDLY